MTLSDSGRFPLEVQLTVPPQCELVPSLLHLGAQHLGRLTAVNRSGSPSPPLILEIWLAGLMAIPSLVRVPPLSPGGAFTSSPIRPGIEALTRTALRILEQS